MFDGILASAFAGIRDLAHRVRDHRKARPLHRTARLSRDPADDEQPEFCYTDPKKAARSLTASSTTRHSAQTVKARKS